MRLKSLTAFIGLASFLIFRAYPAATYYVDSLNGHDSNNGTSPETAWRSISQVNGSWRMFAKGDDLLLKRGSTFIDATLNIQQGGTALDPLIIGAYGQGEKPVIDCGPNYLRGGIICTAGGLGHINIQDLAIRNVPHNNESGIAIAADNITNITISRMDIDNIGNNGIVLAKVDTYVIEDCAISNCTNSGIGIIGTRTHLITNGTIRNNVVHNIARNDGISLHIGGTVEDKVGPNHQLINNEVYNCREQAFDITSGSRITMLQNKSYDNGDSGILVGGCSNVLIDGHYSHTDGLVGIIVGAVRDISIKNSIIYNASNHQLTMGNCSNVRVYDNAIVCGPDSTGSSIDIEGRASVIVLRDNILASTQFSQPRRFVRFLGGISYASTRSDFSNNIWLRSDTGACEFKFFHERTEERE